MSKHTPRYPAHPLGGLTDLVAGTESDHTRISKFLPIGVEFSKLWQEEIPAAIRDRVVQSYRDGIDRYPRHTQLRYAGARGFDLPPGDSVDLITGLILHIASDDYMGVITTTGIKARSGLVIPGNHFYVKPFRSTEVIIPVINLHPRKVISFEPGDVVAHFTVVGSIDHVFRM